MADRYFVLRDESGVVIEQHITSGTSDMPIPDRYTEVTKEEYYGTPLLAASGAPRLTDRQLLERIASSLGVSLT